MKMIVAIIKPFKLDEVKERLRRVQHQTRAAHPVGIVHEDPDVLAFPELLEQVDERQQKPIPVQRRQPALHRMKPGEQR